MLLRICRSRHGRSRRMIRSELVQTLAAENPELGVAEVDRLVSVIFDAITNQLAQGGRVELRGFGAFSTRAREGRVGRNPLTGDPGTGTPKQSTQCKPRKE